MKKDSVTARKRFIREFIRDNPLPEDGKALYAALGVKFPDISAGGHRGLVGRMYDGVRPWEKKHTCPNVARGTCDVVASSTAEGVKLFGHRYNRTQLQSYCKTCRNRARRERNAEVRAARDAQTQEASDA